MALQQHGHSSLHVLLLLGSHLRWLHRRDHRSGEPTSLAAPSCFLSFDSTQNHPAAAQWLPAVFENVEKTQRNLRVVSLSVSCSLGLPSLTACQLLPTKVTRLLFEFDEGYLKWQQSFQNLVKVLLKILRLEEFGLVLQQLMTLKVMMA